MIRRLRVWLLCRFLGHDPRKERLWVRDGQAQWRRYCRDCDVTLAEWSEPAEGAA